MRTQLRIPTTGKVALACAAMLAAACPARTGLAVTLTYSATAPTPDADDVANLVGGSRDGLSLDNGNGLDGAQNDGNSYVAFDRPDQGQTFTTGPLGVGYKINAVWLRHVGYTDNGQAANQEPGYNGTFYMVPANAKFRVRVTNPAQAGNPSFVLDNETTQALTGTEANALPTGLSSSDNGTGTWLRMAFDTPITLSPSTVYGFDVMSVFSTGFGADPFFETLGAGNNYAGGTAYTGAINANAGGPDNVLTDRNADRVFVVELTPAPEPASLALAAAAAVGLMAARRRSS